VSFFHNDLCLGAEEKSALLRQSIRIESLTKRTSREPVRDVCNAVFFQCNVVMESTTWCRMR
jgi:hypothetical protein